MGQSPMKWICNVEREWTLLHVDRDQDAGGSSVTEMEEHRCWAAIHVVLLASQCLVRLDAAALSMNTWTHIYICDVGIPDLLPAKMNALNKRKCQHAEVQTIFASGLDCMC